MLLTGLGCPLAEFGVVYDRIRLSPDPPGCAVAGVLRDKSNDDRVTRAAGWTGTVAQMDVPAFEEDQLVACIMQDARSGEVLTLAFMNRLAYERTRETGEIHFWSRSRQRLWRKGESSGNVMKLRELRFDCDADALLALVDAGGPACHTGSRTCFYRGDMTLVEAEALPSLERTIAQRRERGEVGTSYTAQLLADPALAGAKVREEAEEVTRAVRGESDARVAEEAADVLYHLAVLLASRGLSFDDAHAVLNSRRR